MAAVCVFCSSSERIDVSHLLLAEQVGARIAAGGHSLVSGGARVAAMGAVARAARAGGARTVGVIPEQMVDIEIADHDADQLLIVGSMRERKRLMDEAADAFIVLPGGLGTLEELFEVWTAGALGMHAKPVIVLDPAGVFDPLWDYLDAMRADGFVRQAALDHLHRVRSIEDAFAIIEAG
ncbi:MAG: TIGR00730 family Rossman fold protein [Actinomycetota bacterium]